MLITPYESIKEPFTLKCEIPVDQIARLCGENTGRVCFFVTTTWNRTREGDEEQTVECEIQFLPVRSLEFHK